MGLFQSDFIKVFIGLIVGLAVIIYFNPPKTPCTAQVETYQSNIGTTKKLGKEFSKSLKQCKEHPEPGGCVLFFDNLSKMEGYFNEVSRQCQSELNTDDVTRSWMSLSLQLYTLLAWGSRPPPSYTYRNGWLELSQIVEFCRLRGQFVRVYGKENWDNFSYGLVSDLPGSNDLKVLGPNEVWSRSLLSDPCQYPL